MENKELEPTEQVTTTEEKTKPKDPGRIAAGKKIAEYNKKAREAKKAGLSGRESSDRLRTRVVYKFSCASCNACYIGETSRHFATRVREHLSSDRSPHVFKHLHSSESCRISCSADCFTVLDSATTKFQVKLKESMYIKWEKPDLNQQVKHINLTLSL